MVAVADDDRPGDVGLRGGALQRGGQQAGTLAGQGANELFGVHGPRQWPQARAGAARQKHGIDVAHGRALIDLTAPLLAAPLAVRQHSEQVRDAAQERPVQIARGQRARARRQRPFSAGAISRASRARRCRIGRAVPRQRRAKSRRSPWLSRERGRWSSKRPRPAPSCQRESPASTWAKGVSARATSSFVRPTPVPQMHTLTPPSARAWVATVTLPRQA